MDWLYALYHDIINFASKAVWPATILLIVLIFREKLESLFTDWDKIKFANILLERNRNQIDPREFEKTQKQADQFKTESQDLKAKLEDTKREGLQELTEVKAKSVRIIEFLEKQSENWEIRFLSRYLNAADFKLLKKLKHTNKEIPMSELQLRIQLDPAFPFQSIDNLVAAELVEKTEVEIPQSGGKLPGLFITPKGERFLNAIIEDPLVIDQDKQMEGILSYLATMSKTKK